MHQLHNTLLGEFCQRIEIARSISVAESFNGYCCLSVCLYECRSFSILKQHTNVRIHLSMWISLSLSDLLGCSRRHIILYSCGLADPAPSPSPQLCDRFSNVCLLFLPLLFQIRPNYSTWTCKCQGICTWQITDLARDGLGGRSVNFAVHEV